MQEEDERQFLSFRDAGRHKETVGERFARRCGERFRRGQVFGVLGTRQNRDQGGDKNGDPCFSHVHFWGSGEDVKRARRYANAR
ncbi:hypothetical protein SDC9_210384 [bioreactor metagenome]|uniref:Uncharacterized protein n=1 Tax=bioreactor metagenome TaxID=1076179 RepID=A0A645JHC9_9ZZZZ